MYRQLNELFKAQDVAIGLPLMVSVITILVTIVIHALALLGIFHFVRRQHLLRRTGVRFWGDLAIVSGATMLAGLAHLVEVIIWAFVFVFCGEFGRFGRSLLPLRYELHHARVR